MYSWGAGYWGALGHGDTKDKNVPQRIDTFSGRPVVEIACNAFHSAAVTTKGQLYTWGDGKYGNLGHGNCESSLVPKLVESLCAERVCKVACGTTFTVVVTENGHVYTFGQNQWYVYAP